MLYFNTGITNLSPSNAYIFEEGLTECNCLLFLPTYSNFELYNFYASTKIEVIPIYIYNHKDLFCEFFSKCITDNQVKAYLPAESLSLIDDFDIFPISFYEGARRFMFCL